MANIQSGLLKTKNGTQLMSTNPYPIGSIYLSLGVVSPEQLFGGRWGQIKDRFLLSSGNNYTVGDTGGESEHTLSLSEMPSHSHNINFMKSKNFNSGNMYNAYFPAYATPSTWEAADVSSQGAGSSNPHNNMPPYLVVNVWVRTG